MTLGIQSTRYGTNGPYIQAYPDYNWHSSHGRNCDGLTSVFRVSVSVCPPLNNFFDEFVINVYTDR